MKRRLQPANHRRQPRRSRALTVLTAAGALVAALAIAGCAQYDDSGSGNNLGEPQPTATVRSPDVTGSGSMEDCLRSAGLSSKVDPMGLGAADYVGVYDADKRWIATLKRNETRAEATDLANVDNEMQADSAQKAGEDGWDVGQPPEDRSIAVGNYVVDYVGADPGSDAGRAVTECVKAFTA
jgi:hypothetical protein